MRRLILPLALATTVAALSGCGQKGPLTMAPPATASATPTAKPQPGAHPAANSTSLAPPPASTSRSPFNPIIHQ